CLRPADCMSRPTTELAHLFRQLGQGSGRQHPRTEGMRDWLSAWEEFAEAPASLLRRLPWITNGRRVKSDVAWCHRARSSRGPRLPCWSPMQGLAPDRLKSLWQSVEAGQLAWQEYEAEQARML